MKLNHRQVKIALGIVAVAALGTVIVLLSRSGDVTLDLKGHPQSATSTAAASGHPDLKPIDRVRPFAVMIDNHPEALPQSGIDRAASIFEVPVEGQFTRLMAVFRSGDVPEIGPVRSARPYFLDWAAGLDAVYAHSGGSDEALTQLAAKKQGLDDANEFSNGAYFWRDTGRSAPHNLYTSTGKMRDLIAKKGWAAETDKPDLATRGLTKPDGPAVTAVSVRHLSGGYLSSWDWDEATRTYLRSFDGRPSQTRDLKRESAANVVIIETDRQRIDDPHDKGLIGIRTTGTGEAVVYRAGVKIEGTWSKRSASLPLEIKDLNGQPIPLSDGLIWHDVILTNAGGTVTEANANPLTK